MRFIHLCVVGLAAVAWSSLTTHAGLAQERQRAVVREAPSPPLNKSLPKPPRAVLPPADCLQCYGPGPWEYCLPGLGSSGFLYYGTYPEDDDWFNPFYQCVGGYCGNHAAACARRCIRRHEAHPGFAHGHGMSCHCGGHSCGDCPSCQACGH